MASSIAYTAGVGGEVVTLIREALTQAIGNDYELLDAGQGESLKLRAQDMVSSPAVILVVCGDGSHEVVQSAAPVLAGDANRYYHYMGDRYALAEWLDRVFGSNVKSSIVQPREYLAQSEKYVSSVAQSGEYVNSTLLPTYNTVAGAGASVAGYENLVAGVSYGKSASSGVEAALTQALEESRKEAMAYKRQVSALMLEKQQLEGQVAQAQSLSQGYLSQVADLKNRVAQAQSRGVSVRELEQANSQLSNQIRTLTAQLADKDAQILRLNKDSELSVDKYTYEEKETELREAKEKLVQVQDELVSAREELIKLQAKVDMAVSEAEAARNEAEDYAKKVSSVRVLKPTSEAYTSTYKGARDTESAAIGYSASMTAHDFSTYLVNKLEMGYHLSGTTLKGADSTVLGRFSRGRKTIILDLGAGSAVTYSLMHPIKHAGERNRLGINTPVPGADMTEWLQSGGNVSNYLWTTNIKKVMLLTSQSYINRDWLMNVDWARRLAELQRLDCNIIFCVGTVAGSSGIGLLSLLSNMVEYHTIVTTFSPTSVASAIVEYAPALPAHLKYSIHMLKINDRKMNPQMEKMLKSGKSRFDFIEENKLYDPKNKAKFDWESRYLK